MGTGWLIPVLERQKQADSELEATLVYRASSRTMWNIQRQISVSVSKYKSKNNKKLSSNTMVLYDLGLELLGI